MKSYLIPLFLLLLAIVCQGQQIEVYYPQPNIDPYEVDPFGGNFLSSPITVRGVVAGVSPGGTRGSEYDKHHITLKAWEQDDSTRIRFEKLLVFRPVESDRDFWQDLPPYSIVEFRLFLNEDSTRAVLVAGHFVAEPSPALLAAQAELRAGAFLDTEEFGPFTFNPEVAWFEKELVWQGQPVTVAIQIEDSSELTDHLQTLEQLFAHQTEWQQRVDAYAVQELLPLKNDSWLDYNEPAWEADRFVNTYQLQSIWIFANGTFQFWHTDGDIFGGHYILITGTLDEGPNDADIPG